MSSANHSARSAHRNGSGPISQYLSSRTYLDEHKIPQLFESLLASLMLEKPGDMTKHLDAKLEEVKSKGIDNIDWETFVYDLHPLRDPKRKEIVKENPPVTNKKHAHQVKGDAHCGPDVFKLTQPQA